MSSIVLSRPSLLSACPLPFSFYASLSCLAISFRLHALCLPLPQHKNGLFCSKVPQKVPSQNKIGCFLF